MQVHILRRTHCEFNFPWSNPTFSFIDFLFDVCTPFLCWWKIDDCYILILSKIDDDYPTAVTDQRSDKLGEPRLLFN